MRLLEEPSNYRAFLLRFWQERGCTPEPCPWRFSLEDPRTGERRGYGSFEAFIAGLWQQIAGDAGELSDREWWKLLNHLRERRAELMNRSLRTVEDILKVKGRQVWSVTPDTTVFEALELMARHEIGAVVVLEEDRIVGIMSERDYARKVILRGRASRDTPVRSIMTEKVITVLPTTTVEECMALMTTHRIRHLPVVDQGKLVGLVSIGDVVKAIISEQQYVIERYRTMRDYAEP